MLDMLGFWKPRTKSRYGRVYTKNKAKVDWNPPCSYPNRIRGREETPTKHHKTKGSLVQAPELKGQCATTPPAEAWGEAYGPKLRPSCMLGKKLTLTCAGNSLRLANTGDMVTKQNGGHWWWWRLSFLSLQFFLSWAWSWWWWLLLLWLWWW